MNDKQYRTISTGRGGKLRDLANNMLQDAKWLPTKSELKAHIAELYPDAEHEPIREALVVKLTEVAKAGQDRQARWELRQKINETVLALEEGLTKSDAIVIAQESEDVDMNALLERVAEDKAGGEYALKEERENAERYNEAERIRSLGGGR